MALKIRVLNDSKLLLVNLCPTKSIFIFWFFILQLFQPVFSEGLIPPKKNRISILTDLYGEIYSFKNQDFKTESRNRIGSAAVFAMYQFGNWGVGGGGALGVDYYRNYKFDVKTTDIVKSIGFATEYRFGNNSIINYQVLGRMYYQFTDTKIEANNSVIFDKNEGISGVLGIGPTFQIARFQLSPVLNVNWMSRFDRGASVINTGIFINLYLPIF